MSANESVRGLSLSFRPSLNADSLVRMLVATYFLASVMGVIRDPILNSMLTAYAANTAPQLLLVSSLAISALLLAFGHFQRQAALYLAVFTLWSTVLHFGQSWSPGALRGLWLQLLVAGALVMIAMNTGRAPARAAPRARRASKRTPVAPRRISVRRPAGDAALVEPRAERLRLTEHAAATPALDGIESPEAPRSRMGALLSSARKAVGRSGTDARSIAPDEADEAPFVEVPDLDPVETEAPRRARALSELGLAPERSLPVTAAAPARVAPAFEDDDDLFDEIENIFADLDAFEGHEDRDVAERKRAHEPA